MELIRGAHNLRPWHRCTVATVGNFDGLHLGHQAVLGQLAEKGAELSLPATAISFQPLPREYFMGEKAPPRLQRFRDKVLAMRRFSVDRLLCLRFDRQLAEQTAERFVEELLVERLGVRYVVVGDDFRFGRDRAGDFHLLRDMGARLGFQVANMHSFLIDGQRVSSTRIRDALGRGDMNTAQRLLGRPYRLSGRVAHGEKRGRQIGFPTANLPLGPRPLAARGVYAVEVFGLDQDPVRGVANVGKRPTVGGQLNRLEVHLFNFDGDLYGRHLRVDLLVRIRDEQRFESLDALKAQIAQDAVQARQYFGLQT